MRLLLVCPGRGSYGRNQLRTLQGDNLSLRALDAYRASLGRPTLRELDAAERFSPSLHLAGEHASLLTFGATVADLDALDPERAQVVAVAGNSMGWYTALYAAGALSLLDAARLVETMGAMQKGNIVGAQVLYPTVGEDWRPDPGLEAAVEAALALPGVYRSIRLGGTAVLGCTPEALPGLLAALPRLDRGERSFPAQLPMHSAFHTPLLAPSGARARVELADLPWHSPRTSLVSGHGHLFRPWSTPGALAEYTLGAQITEPFDLTLCVRAALGDFAPDAVLLPGPGNTLGAAVAQILIGCGWRGLRDRRDFEEAQRGQRPPVLSLDRPEQRALVAR